MAINKTARIASMLSQLKALYRNDPPANKVQDDDYFLEQLVTILANGFFDEMTTNARCNGTDSNGDSHSNVGII